MLPSSHSSGHSLPALWIPPALLLIAAALAKAQDPLPFLLEISNYGFRFPPALEALLVLLLPGAEILLGGLLLFGRSRRVAALSIALLAAFSIGILAALPAGYLHRCGCLGPEKLDPTLALIKNGIAVALLVMGFLPLARRSGKTNSWGALGVVVGGTISNPIMAGMVVLVALLSFLAGRRCLFALLIGLLLGFAMKLAGFPLVSLVIVGFVLFFFAVEERRPGVWPALACSALIAAICWMGFIHPPAPKISPPVLQVGQPLPSFLAFEKPLVRDPNGKSLLLFLQPDCDECQDWLPLASAMARRPGWPPLTAIIPGTSANAVDYQQREEIAYEVKAIGAANFHRMVRRTPLLILAEGGRVMRIFKEGSMPQPTALEEALR